MLVECTGLKKCYGTKQALAGIDLSVAEGDVLGLLGPNGAGKSTLIKLMTGLIWPTDGSVSIHGHDVHSEHARALEQVGAIIEWPTFIPYLTARQNLAILTGGHGADFEGRMKEVMDFVEMTPNLDNRVERFSTGMRQRLGIALALLPQSRFVILDEPTNGLDPNGIAEVRQILKDSNKRFGTTILLCSHLLQEVEQVCDKVAILHNGEIAAQGTLESFLSDHGLLRIVATPKETAVQVLEELQIETREEEGSLLATTPADQAAEINAALVRGGCAVSHISHQRRSLADAFHQITGGQTDVA